MGQIDNEIVQIFHILLNRKDSYCCDIRNKPKVRIQDFEDAYKANRRLR